MTVEYLINIFGISLYQVKTDLTNFPFGYNSNDYDVHLRNAMPLQKKQPIEFRLLLWKDSFFVFLEHL